MCLITMGLLAALAPAALYVGRFDGVEGWGRDAPAVRCPRAPANDDAASARLQHL
jgi:hypothetical protein